ncbi:hypothetical protein J6590_012631 [Homalodisca vitripennis]|nr:hypothetical protein J6590_012631 [Homalodisca vitripennis]
MGLWITDPAVRDQTDSAHHDLHLHVQIKGLFNLGMKKRKRGTIVRHNPMSYNVQECYRERTRLGIL